MSKEQNHVFTPVDRDNISILLKRLDNTGLRWSGFNERPSRRIFPSNYNIKTLHISGSYLLWGGAVKDYREVVESGEYKLVTWNEFVRIARERCGDNK